MNELQRLQHHEIRRPRSVPTLNSGHLCQTRQTIRPQAGAKLRLDTCCSNPPSRKISETHLQTCCHVGSEGPLFPGKLPAKARARPSVGACGRGCPRSCCSTASFPSACPLHPVLLQVPHPITNIQFHGAQSSPIHSTQRCQRRWGCALHNGERCKRSILRNCFVPKFYSFMIF